MLFLSQVVLQNSADVINYTEFYSSGLSNKPF